MEKNKPSCPLATVKALIEAGKYRITFIALQTGGQLGFDRDGIIAEVLKLEMSEFYKSMTTYKDHKVWQDVYRHKSDVGMLYIKLTTIDDVLVVSFKEL